MLIALAAPCLSEHISIDAGPTFLQCLSSRRSVLCVAQTLPLRIYEHYAAYGEAYHAELSCNPSHHSQSKVWIVCVRCLHNCLISAEYNRVTKCLEWRFTTFIDLDFKPLVCFWRVHKSKRLAPTSFPLGALRRENLLKLHAFVVTSWFNGVRLAGTPSLRQIISVISRALLRSFIYIPLTGPRQRKSVQYWTGQWVMRVFPLNLENQKKKALYSTSLMGFAGLLYLCVCIWEAVIKCTVALTSDHVCSIRVLVCVLGDVVPKVRQCNRDGEIDMDSGMSYHILFYIFKISF